MSGFTDAVSWLPGEATLDIFVVHEGAPPRLAVPAALSQPRPIRPFRLEEGEGDRLLGPRTCTEFNLVYDVVPPDVADVLEAVLIDVVHQGALLAFGAFETSFSFEHFLTADIAEQVYAVADASGVDLALDDDRRSSSEWADRLERARLLAVG